MKNIQMKNKINKMKTMKTMLIILAILMLGTTLGTSTPKVNESIFDFPEEYIDDIPFDTDKVINQDTFKMEEEGYIDDIPFNTEKVVEELS